MIIKKIDIIKKSYFKIQ